MLTIKNLVKNFNEGTEYDIYIFFLNVLKIISSHA